MEFYQVTKKIASGNEGSVFLCTHKENSNRKFAIKVLACSCEEEKDSVQDQVKHVLKLKHRNLVRHFEQFVEQIDSPLNEPIYHVYIAMNYCTLGSLESVLKQHGTKVPVQAKQEWITQLCSGIQFLHDTVIVAHKDIKSDNILFSISDDSTDDLSELAESNEHDYGRYVVRICDFGLTKYDKGGCPLPNLGSPIYMAPELFDREKLDGDRESDIWALGVVILQILLGVDQLSLPDVREMVKKDKGWLHSFGVEHKLNPKLLRICSMCCQIDPSKRPNIQRVIDELRSSSQPSNPIPTTTPDSTEEEDDLDLISNARMMSTMLTSPRATRHSKSVNASSGLSFRSMSRRLTLGSFHQIPSPNTLTTSTPTTPSPTATSSIPSPDLDKDLHSPRFGSLPSQNFLGSASPQLTRQSRPFSFSFSRSFSPKSPNGISSPISGIQEDSEEQIDIHMRQLAGDIHRATRNGMHSALNIIEGLQEEEKHENANCQLM